MRKPLCIDGFCGLGGWAEGFLAEGWSVIGFDIERHVYGPHRYPGQLVIQDMLTVHGSQFKDADCLVMSPPCQQYSWMAMPWMRAKAKAAAIRADESGKMLADLNRLFDACFRIQKEASLAAGRRIPMVVENVRGAQPWVGRARWMYGSFALWGDVPALMPYAKEYKSSGMNWSDRTKTGQDFTRCAAASKVPGFRFDGSGRSSQSVKATKNNGGLWFTVAHNTTSGKGQNPDGRKVPGGGADGWFGENDHPLRQHHSGHRVRKEASAMIAKIPAPLARHIARVYRP